MQWYIRTTEELRERIEKIYRLDNALHRLDGLSAEVDNLSLQIERDLRPSKVQHEMRLKALEPLLEQADDRNQLGGEILSKMENLVSLIDQWNEEDQQMRAELNGLKEQIEALKSEKVPSTDEKTAVEIEKLRAEIEALKAERAKAADEQSTAAQSAAQQTAVEIEKLRSEIETLKSERAKAADEHSAAAQSAAEQTAVEIEKLRSEIETLKSERSQSTEIDQLRSEIEELKSQQSQTTDKQSEMARAADKKSEMARSTAEQTAVEIEKVRAEIGRVEQIAVKATEPQSQSIDELNRIAEKFQSNLEAKDEEIKQLWQLFSDRIEAKEAEIDRLKTQATALTKELEDRGSTIGELIRQIDHLWKKFDELETKNAPPAPQEPPLTPPRSPSKSVAATPPDDAPRIMQFAIDASNAVYIDGTPEEITTRLKAAMNVEELKTFLDGSKAANKVIFLRSLDRHVRNLQKLTYKLNFDEYPDGTASEAITRKYFEIFCSTLLESVTSTSYRGISRQTDFYREFLKHFNRYLQRCGIFTRQVLPGSRVGERDEVDMKITRRAPNNASNKNLIVEVERLPYYINYRTSDGKTKCLFFEGKMTAYGK